MTAHRPLSTCRVLVVEDELLVAMGLEMALADAGCLVVGPVGRYEQAMTAAKRETMDIALLDVNLRGVEIYPIADELAGRGIPFAFLTGYGRETLPARFAGARVMCKPFQVDELIATVGALMDGGRLNRA